MGRVWAVLFCTWRWLSAVVFPATKTPGPLCYALLLPWFGRLASHWCLCLPLHVCPAFTSAIRSGQHSDILPIRDWPILGPLSAQKKSFWCKFLLAFGSTVTYVHYPLPVYQCYERLHPASSLCPKSPALFSGFKIVIE